MTPNPKETRRRFAEAVKAAKNTGVPALHEDTSWDFETYSEADIRSVGGSRYARHPSTEVLMLTVQDSQGQMIQWVPAFGDEVPERMLHLLLDPTTTKQAWNARFELDIFENVLGYPCPLEEWKCVMVMAASQALPMDLATAGVVVGLPDDMLKMSDGKRLIKKFSVPRKPSKKNPSTRVYPKDDPEDFELFLKYNRQDVKTERAILSRIRKWDMPDHEWHLWRIDQRINQAGIPVNRAMVENAIRIYDDVFSDRMDRMKAVTGLENPNSGSQLLPWLRAHGYPWHDLKKGHVKRALRDADDLGLDPDTRNVLRWRSEISRTSVKKYSALLEALDDDDRLRGCLQFCGAGRTWRWSGRRFQPQNLARPTKEYEKRIHYAVDLVEHSFAWAIEQIHDTPIDLLSSTIRSVVQAPEGYEFQDADLNAIENRVLGWVAESDTILKVFREGRCPYLDFATRMFRQPYHELLAEYEAGNKQKRTIAKPGVLGCFGPETLVLTPRGWVPLIQVHRQDLVFDGLEFVAHGGVVNQGVREVIDFFGVEVTPDHKILCGDRWEEAYRVKSESRLMRQALGSGIGPFNTRNIEVVRVGRTDADANAATKNGSGEPICVEDSAPVAFRAHCGLDGSRIYPPRSLIDTLIGFTRSVLGAEILKTPSTVTMEVGESSVDSVQRKILCSIWNRFPGLGTLFSKWIGKTMTGIMNPAIYDWFLGESRPVTPGKTSKLSTVGEATQPLSFGKDTVRDTETFRQFFGKLKPDFPRSRSSKTSGDVEARTVYDLVNAGPRSRFTILTQEGPVIVHNCGYMLSGGDEKENSKTGEIERTGLWGYADSMGISMTREQAHNSVFIFRETYVEVVELWWALDRAAREVIRTGVSQRVGKVVFDKSGPYMRIRLPSGRYLHYLRPKLVERATPWGKIRVQVSYEGKDQITGKWTRITTHPGKLTENIVQAISRDLLAHGILLAHERYGLRIVLHVHDQIVTMAAAAESKETLEILNKCLETNPGWAPDLPLASEGFTDTIFRKD